jgi:hypothetical protein
LKEPPGATGWGSGFDLQPGSTPSGSGRGGAVFPLLETLSTPAKGSLKTKAFLYAAAIKKRDTPVGITQLQDLAE